jgi:hypothetical protein
MSSPREADDVHGGIDRSRQFESVSAHLRNGGFLWQLLKHERIFEAVNGYVGKERTYDNQQP